MSAGTELLDAVQALRDRAERSLRLAAWLEREANLCCGDEPYGLVAVARYIDEGGA